MAARAGSCFVTALESLGYRYCRSLLPLKQSSGSGDDEVIVERSADSSFLCLDLQVPALLSWRTLNLQERHFPYTGRELTHCYIRKFLLSRSVDAWTQFEGTAESSLFLIPVENHRGWSGSIQKMNPLRLERISVIKHLPAAGHDDRR